MSDFCGATSVQPTKLSGVEVTACSPPTSSKPPLRWLMLTVRVSLSGRNHAKNSFHGAVFGLTTIVSVAPWISSSGEFPPLAAGIWELKTVRTLPDGTTQGWSLQSSLSEHESDISGLLAFSNRRKGGLSFPIDEAS